MHNRSNMSRSVSVYWFSRTATWYDRAESSRMQGHLKKYVSAADDVSILLKRAVLVHPTKKGYECWLAYENMPTEVDRLFFLLS
jgi:hypothetical protein